MLSTILELVGFTAIIASAVLLGTLIAGLLAALAAGLVTFGAVLVILSLALDEPVGKRAKRR